ncbi:Glycine/D-amino acid oxidase-like deaminating enzyme [Hyphomicrobiales bacterium]|nr:Glycine/D-amino acid oxidase-like deaminating enzyme [Hyphomicrobiales bacterium]CAH1690790.1 FAD-binding oxidoreductase [Hyphomicrobiales bacterium]
MSEAMETDICVVGGGLVGCSAALHLARAGRSATLVERDSIGAHASGVNFGGVRRHGRNERELPLSVRSLDIWRNMRELIGNNCEFMATGHLKIARTETEMTALEQWQVFGARHGIYVELYSGTDLRRRFPWLASSIFGASFCPGDGQANPRLAAPAFALRAKAEGVQIREGDAVKVVEDCGSGFRIILTSGLRIHANSVVNAAGAWGSAIAAHFGDDAPVTPIAPQMFVSEPAPYIIEPVLGMVSGGLYLRQIPRGNVIFGGGRGVLGKDERHSWPRDEIFAQTVGLAATIIPHLKNLTIIRSWTGIEGNCADGLPIVGPSPSRAGLYHAFGFSGHGFQMAPAAGAVISELITKGETPTDISALSPQRFGSCVFAAAMAESEI